MGGDNGEQGGFSETTIKDTWKKTRGVESRERGGDGWGWWWRVNADNYNLTTIK